MKVTEHINQAKDTLVSFEILPPLKGKSIQSIFEHLDPLMLSIQVGLMLPTIAVKACLRKNQMVLLIK